VAAGSFGARFRDPARADCFDLLLFAGTASGVGLVVALGHRSSGGGRISLYAARASLLGLTLVGALAAAEAVARRSEPLDPYAVIPDDGGGPLYRRDRLLGRVHRPGFVGHFVHPQYHRERVHIDAEGFRGAGFPTAKPEGEYRIFAIGDSQTFGLGVEDDETYAARLEERLSKRFGPGGRRIRVVNAGVSGTGTMRQYMEYVTRFLEYRPDAILVGVYPGNDLEEIFGTVKRGAREGFLEEFLPDVRPRSIDPPPRVAPPFGVDESVEGGKQASPIETPSVLQPIYWKRGSSLYRTIEERLTILAMKRGWIEAPAVVNRNLLDSFREEPGIVIRRALRVLEPLLAEWRRRAGEEGCEMVLVLIPAKIQCEPERLADFLRAVGERPDEYDPTLVNRRIAEAAAKAGIPLLDLLPAMRERMQAGQRTYFLEGHLDREGHRFVAEQIDEFLERKALGPYRGR
jgi:lysophospholipase L1-like esterase